MVPWFAVRTERSKGLAVTSRSPLLSEGLDAAKNREEREYMQAVCGDCATKIYYGRGGRWDRDE